MRAETDGRSGPDASVRTIGHVGALDGIRGVAVLLVLLSHTPFLTNPFTQQVFYIGPLDRFVHGGFLGVDIFFVLSGFLITALLLKEIASRDTPRFGAFYRRRALRLLPALVVLLGAHLAYTLITHLPTRPEITTDWSSLLYVANYKSLRSGAPLSESMGHLWSLSVEEQFYLLWPATLTIALAAFRKRSYFIIAMITATALVALNRAQMWPHVHDWSDVFFRTDTRADSLLIGALAAWAWSRGLVARNTRAAGWFALGAVTLFVYSGTTTSSWLYYGGFTGFAVAVAVLVVAALDEAWRGRRLFELAPLRAVGRVSYGLYLWHFPVFFAVDRYFTGSSGRTRVLLAYALSAAFTIASWYVVERPALRWKDRLEARDRQRAAAVSVAT